MQTEIANASYKYQRAVELKEKIIVGVNQFTEKENVPTDLLRVDDSIRKLQADKLVKLRAKRNKEHVIACLKNIKNAAREDKNLMPFVIEAVENYATLGEIADALREIYGEYHG
jgi:methylmalonyl-CoA mutase N-terminal domain/subunit